MLNGGWKVAAGAVRWFVTRRVNPAAWRFSWRGVWGARAPPSCVRERITFSRESDAKMYVIEIRMWILARYEIAPEVPCSRIAALPAAFG